MDKKRYNELILLSQRIHEYANEQLKEYLEKTYADAGTGSMGDQLEDWLFVAEETSAYSLGNAIAMLEPESQEVEIRTFEENLRRVISFAGKKQAGEEPPERLQ